MVISLLNEGKISIHLVGIILLGSCFGVIVIQVYIPNPAIMGRS